MPMGIGGDVEAVPEDGRDGRAEPGGEQQDRRARHRLGMVPERDPVAIERVPER